MTDSISATEVCLPGDARWLYAKGRYGCRVTSIEFRTHPSSWRMKTFLCATPTDARVSDDKIK